MKLSILNNLVALVVMTSISTSALAYVQNEPTSAFSAIRSAADQADGQVLEVMRTNVRAFAENGSIAENNRQSIFLSCLVGGIALIAGGRVGFCVDGAGHTYNLKASSIGLSAGFKASLIFGIVKTSDQSVRGRYSNFSLGMAGPIQGVKLGKLLSGLNAGVGVDVLSASSDTGKSLILIGPALGSMIDFSMISLAID
jgi:hypothetical protein